MKKTNRIDYFDFARGIGMICVFIYHLYSNSVSVNVWVRTFAVQLFFVISGCLTNYTDKKKLSLKEFVIKSFKNLIIPYMFFCLIYDSIEGLQYGINDFFGALKGSLLLTPRGALWFLPVLFLSQIMLYFFNSKSVNKKILFVVSMIIYWIGMALTKGYVNQYTVLIIRTCIAFGYLVFGYLIFPFLKKININLIILLLLIYLFYIISLKNGVTSMFGCYFNNLILNFIISFCSCLLVLLLCKKIKKLSLINWVGKNSLIIMCTHQKIIELITSKIIIGYPYNTIVPGIINSMMILIFEFVVVYFINKYLPFILGKTKKTN